MRVTDEQLIEKIRREGSAAATEELMERYKEMVRGRARALFLIGGDTEDLIQEGMIGLFRAVRDYDPAQGASFSTFAQLCVSRQLATAIEASLRGKNRPLNEAISIDSAQQAEEEAGSGTFETAGLIGVLAASPEDEPEEIIAGRDSVARALSQIREKLSPMEREVFELMLAGMDYRGIAAELKRDPKSIDNAIQRIRTKARRVIEE